MIDLETIYDFFPEQKKESIEKLIEDPSFQKQIPSLILDRIKKSSNKIIPIEDEMIPWFFSRAEFSNLEESYKMSSMFRDYLSYEKRFLPLAIDYLSELETLKERNSLTKRRFYEIGKNFASRCLFSLSFFYDGLEELYNRRGSPHPEFYRETGKRIFSKIGEESISDNFDNWEEYIREEAFS